MLYDKKWDKEVKVVDEVGQAMLNAADYIDKHGHCKHTPKNSQGEVCLMGALLHSSNLEFEIWRQTIGLPACLRLKKILGMEPANWNDMPERTAEEVTAMLRHAAYNQE